MFVFHLCLNGVFFCSAFHYSDTAQQTCKCVINDKKPAAEPVLALTLRCREGELMKYQPGGKTGLLMFADWIRVWLLAGLSPHHQHQHRSAPQKGCERFQLRENLSGEHSGALLRRRRRREEEWGRREGGEAHTAGLEWTGISCCYGFWGRKRHYGLASGSSRLGFHVALSVCCHHVLGETLCRRQWYLTVPLVPERCSSRSQIDSFH